MPVLPIPHRLTEVMLRLQRRRRGRNAERAGGVNTPPAIVDLRRGELI
ncbi:hypothetical protein [Rhodococcus sp. 1168]|nr:hypothetical protein [Rhodococcus sp. 1168]